VRPWRGLRAKLPVAGRGSGSKLQDHIHLSAWKGNPAKFAGTAPWEVPGLRNLRVLQYAPSRRCQTVAREEWHPPGIVCPLQGLGLHAHT
jgi:hypothetical protein